MNEAADAIRRIANQKDVKLHVCTVDSVSGSTCDVTPISGEAPLKKVRLNANINSSLGIVITPVTGSDKHVLVCEVSPADSYVCMFSEIEKIEIKIGQTTILIKDGEVSFNGGNNKGLVKVDDMVGWMNKVYADMVTIQGLLTGLGLTFTPQTGMAISADFANPKVKH